MSDKPQAKLNEAKLAKMVDRLKAGLAKSVSKEQMRKLGEEATRLIVKRTRLGYGVQKEGGERFPLSSISWTDRYKKLRKTFPLDETTRPRKSNLTLTGQMLRSIKVIKIDGKSVTIAPTGWRSEKGLDNETVAAGNAKRGRVFLNLSANEYAQIARVYRKSYTDLMRQLKKIAGD